MGCYIAEAAAEVFLFQLPLPVQLPLHQLGLLLQEGGLTVEASRGG